MTTMTATNPPRIRRTAQNTQFTYNLAGRIHDVQPYPVVSPQGATVLLYGTDHGVTLVWRGGRRFKPPKKPVSANEKLNGAGDGQGDSAVMVIDSDEEEAPPAKGKTSEAFVDSPQFEERAADSAYPEIVQTLELSFGTAGLHIAVPPVTPCQADEAPTELLKVKMVFAVSCATNEVFVVTLPLTPPSPESKARPELRHDLLAGKAGSGLWGEALIALGGQTRYADGIAMALIKPRSSPTSGKLKDQAGTVASASPKPRIVVAAHNREASGVLRLWDVSLDCQPGSEGRAAEPFQTEYLPSPLTRIAFNPTHTTQLLAVCSPHATRIYDYAVPSITPDESTGPFPTQGSWLLSLYQPFVRPTSTRKPILDAAWVAHGRAVFALFADGTWGIWDIDGASPLGAATILGKHGPGIRGAALTAFSATGHVEGVSPLRTAGGQVKSRSSGGLEPMTPHTRRDAAASLASAGAPERLAAVRGGVAVVALPVTAGGGGADESLVLWVGSHDHVCVVPALSRFWETQMRRGAGAGVNLFSGAQPTRMVRLHDLSTGLLGERCAGVAATVNFDKFGRGRGGGASSSRSPPPLGGYGAEDGGLPVEVLVRGESRLVVVREAEDGPGARIGGVVSARRRLFGKDRGALPAGADGAGAGSRQFDLSISKAGALLAPPEDEEDGSGQELTLPSRPRVGFAFEEELSRAADAEGGSDRDVEVEMLDIMEIDRALEDMEEERGSGRKKVFFEED